MKKLLRGFVALSMVLAMTGCGTGSSSSSDDLSSKKIGVIQLMKHIALDKSYEGFKDVLVDAGVKEENIDYQVAGDQSNCTTVADKLVNGDNDLIYAIATPALQAAASATSDLPSVGCAVTDYESTKLVKSNEKPGGNVTGASDLTPIAQQFDLLKELLPNAKKVGIMYCSSEDNSKIQGAIAEKAAKKLGLEYVTRTVSDSNDIQSVVTQLTSNDDVDVIYIPTDNVLATYMSSVEAVASDAKIPVICGEEGMCQEGGFATNGIDYYNLGKLAGQQALAILKGEKTAAETPIEYLAAKDCQMVINLKVAKKCGIEINKDDYKDATFIE